MIISQTRYIIDIEMEVKQLSIADTIKQLAEDNNTNMAQMCKASNLSHSNIVHKIERNSLYYSDIEKLLDSIGYKLKIVKK